MGHDHSHDHGTADRRRLRWAALIVGGFMVAEIAGGLASGSLALLSDAAHSLTDATSLAGAWLAFILAAKPADRRRPFGYHRFPVLAAFTNGVVLVGVVAWIAVEAVQRFLNPTEVIAPMMAGIAAVGLVMNLVVFWVLQSGDRGNLNIRGAAVHVLGDMLGSFATLVGAGVIAWTGWTPIDPLLSLLVAAIVLRSAWKVLRDAAHVLLEGTPEGLEADRLAPAVAADIDGVAESHAVASWSLAPERPVVSLHATLDDAADPDAVLAAIKHYLAERWGAAHSFVQVERGPCPDAAG